MSTCLLLHCHTAHPLHSLQFASAPSPIGQNSSPLTQSPPPVLDALSQPFYRHKPSTDDPTIAHFIAIKAHPTTASTQTTRVGQPPLLFRRALAKEAQDRAVSMDKSYPAIGWAAGDGVGVRLQTTCIYKYINLCLQGVQLEDLKPAPRPQKNGVAADHCRGPRLMTERALSGAPPQKRPTSRPPRYTVPRRSGCCWHIYIWRNSR